MNQILVTKKLYITPELKRKKKVYQINFMLSIFLVISLISIYIYAEFDRNKSQEVSQEILSGIQDSTVTTEDALVVHLSDTTINGIEEEQLPSDTNNGITTESTNGSISSVNGYNYKTIGTINIPKISVTYPILDGETDSVAETDELLKVAPTKFWGPDFNENWGEAPNKQGNLVLVGHNYRNGMFFSDVPTLVNGDIIEITDINGSTVKYSVYDKYSVDPTDVSSTSQNTNGRREITLITCTDDNVERVIVKARAI